MSEVGHSTEQRQERDSFLVPEHFGFLHKKAGQLFPASQRNWFELRKEKLFYYEKRPTTDEERAKQSGCVDLTEAVCTEYEKATPDVNIFCKPVSTNTQNTSLTNHDQVTDVKQQTSHQRQQTGVSVQGDEWSEGTWTITGPQLKKGLTLTASSSEEKRQWISKICAAVNQCSRMSDAKGKRTQSQILSSSSLSSLSAKGAVIPFASAQESLPTENDVNMRVEADDEPLAEFPPFSTLNEANVIPPFQQGSVEVGATPTIETSEKEDESNNRKTTPSSNNSCSFSTSPSSQRTPSMFSASYYEHQHVHQTLFSCYASPPRRSRRSSLFTRLKTVGNNENPQDHSNRSASDTHLAASPRLCVPSQQIGGGSFESPHYSGNANNNHIVRSKDHSIMDVTNTPLPTNFRRPPSLGLFYDPISLSTTPMGTVGTPHHNHNAANISMINATTQQNEQSGDDRGKGNNRKGYVTPTHFAPLQEGQQFFEEAFFQYPPGMSIPDEALVMHSGEEPSEICHGDCGQHFAINTADESKSSGESKINTTHLKDSPYQHNAPYADAIHAINMRFNPTLAAIVQQSTAKSTVGLNKSHDVQISNHDPPRSSLDAVPNTALTGITSMPTAESAGGHDNEPSPFSPEATVAVAGQLPSIGSNPSLASPPGSFASLPAANAATPSSTCQTTNLSHSTSPKFLSVVDYPAATTTARNTDLVNQGVRNHTHFGDDVRKSVSNNGPTMTTMGRRQSIAGLWDPAMASKKVSFNFVRAPWSRERDSSFFDPLSNPTRSRENALFPLLHGGATESGRTMLPNASPPTISLSTQQNANNYTINSTSSVSMNSISNNPISFSHANIPMMPGSPVLTQSSYQSIQQLPNHVINHGLPPSVQNTTMTPRHYDSNHTHFSLSHGSGGVNARGRGYSKSSANVGRSAAGSTHTASNLQTGVEKNMGSRVDFQKRPDNSHNIDSPANASHPSGVCRVTVPFVYRFPYYHSSTSGNINHTTMGPEHSPTRDATGQRADKLPARAETKLGIISPTQTTSSTSSAAASGNSSHSHVRGLSTSLHHAKGPFTAAASAVTSATQRSFQSTLSYVTNAKPNHKAMNPGYTPTKVPDFNYFPTTSKQGEESGMSPNSGGNIFIRAIDQTHAQKRQHQVCSKMGPTKQQYNEACHPGMPHTVTSDNDIHMSQSTSPATPESMIGDNRSPSCVNQSLAATHAAREDSLNRPELSTNENIAPSSSNLKLHLQSQQQRSEENNLILLQSPTVAPSNKSPRELSSPTPVGRTTGRNPNLGPNQVNEEVPDGEDTALITKEDTCHKDNQEYSCTIHPSNIADASNQSSLMTIYNVHLEMYLGSYAEMSHFHCDVSDSNSLSSASFHRTNQQVTLDGLINACAIDYPTPPGWAFGHVATGEVGEGDDARNRVLLLPYLGLPIRDAMETRLDTVMPTVYTFIDRVVENKIATDMSTISCDQHQSDIRVRIGVFCLKGISRSPSIVMGVILYYRQLKLVTDATDMVSQSQAVSPIDIAHTTMCRNNYSSPEDEKVITPPAQPLINSRASPESSLGRDDSPYKAAGYSLALFRCQARSRANSLLTPREAGGQQEGYVGASYYSMTPQQGNTPRTRVFSGIGRAALGFSGPPTALSPRDCPGGGWGDFVRSRENSMSFNMPRGVIGSHTDTGLNQFILRSRGSSMQVGVGPPPFIHHLSLAKPTQVIILPPKNDNTNSSNGLYYHQIPTATKENMNVGNNQTASSSIFAPSTKSTTASANTTLPLASSPIKGDKTSKHNYAMMMSQHHINSYTHSHGVVQDVLLYLKGRRPAVEPNVSFILQTISMLDTGWYLDYFVDCLSRSSTETSAAGQHDIWTNGSHESQYAAMMMNRAQQQQQDIRKSKLQQQQQHQVPAQVQAPQTPSPNPRKSTLNNVFYDINTVPLSQQSDEPVRVISKTMSPVPMSQVGGGEDDLESDYDLTSDG